MNGAYKEYLNQMWVAYGQAGFGPMPEIGVFLAFLQNADEVLKSRGIEVPEEPSVFRYAEAMDQYVINAVDAEQLEDYGVDVSSMSDAELAELLAEWALQLEPLDYYDGLAAAQDVCAARAAASALREAHPRVQAELDETRETR